MTETCRTRRRILKVEETNLWTCRKFVLDIPVERSFHQDWKRTSVFTKKRTEGLLKISIRTEKKWSVR